MPAPHRVVILGASNVTLAFPLIVSSLARSFPAPLEIVAAHGHGRSFCRWSHVFNRGLPGIVESRLWTDLEASLPAQQTWGLITDVGNDLLYGYTPKEVMQRVNWCFDRLTERGADIVCVRPPMARLACLTSRGYRIAKGILFPRSSMDWNAMRKMAQELDDRLCASALAKRATLVIPEFDWYGLDPIHVRRRKRIPVWREILNSWPGAPEVNTTTVPGQLARRIWMQRPAQRTLFGRMQLAGQPSLELLPEIRVWLY